MRLAREVRQAFLLSKGNHCGLLVDDMQRRIDIEVCRMLLFPSGKHRKRQNKKKES